jgi:CheY-like chemotaxis protein
MAKSDQKPILLVEDNNDDVLLFKRALKRAGLANPVFVVGDVTSAKQYLEGEGELANRSRYPLPSVLVVDLKLPDGSGLDFLRWLRSQPKYRAFHCLILTGDVRVSTFQACYDSGANSFLRKPCDHQDLLNVATGFARHWLPEEPESKTT